MRRLLSWLFNDRPPRVTVRPIDYLQDDEIIKRREREDQLMDEIRERLDDALKQLDQPVPAKTKSP